MVRPGATGEDAKIVYKGEESSIAEPGRTHRRRSQSQSVFGIMSNRMLRRLG